MDLVKTKYKQNMQITSQNILIQLYRKHSKYNKIYETSMDKVIIKSTANVCFGQAKTDRVNQ
jgi:hypothetical protein